MAQVNLPTPNLNTKDAQSLARYLKQVVDKLNEYHSLKEVEDAEKDMKILELEKEVTELKEQIKLLSRKG
ncbi:MAG: hypothetical protein IKL07_06585 [Clostridium sp.]|nr:hypothetical protein [Clostridium sp.]